MASGSCSTRLDWEYTHRARLNALSVVVFSIAAVLLTLLATFIWMAASSEPFLHSLFWSLSTAFGSAPGADASWTDSEYSLTLAWMSICAIYWASLLGVITTWIGEFFER
jgi:hypothetical protein